MLSRLQPRTAATSLLKCISQNQTPAVCVGTTSVLQNETYKRDLVNFPRPTRLEKSPETVFGFLPKSWFDFMYPKTGVTGPYMLLTGIATYLFSKEVIVVNAEFSLALSAVCAIAIIQMKFGPAIQAYAEKGCEAHKEMLDRAQNQQKIALKEALDSYSKAKHELQGVLEYLPEAKRENVYLQMEAAYRARIQDAYTKVKKQMDYHIERDNIHRRIEQKNLVSWVIRNVEESISPQLKKNALKQCIGDLKALAARA